jgi:uncharacterized sulfatase
MIRWPGKVAPRVSDDLAMSIDFAPTILSVLGQKPTPEMQGINLLEDEAVKRRQSIYGACFTHNAVDLNDPSKNSLWRWSIKDRWRVILPAAAAQNSQIELYDIVADPHEKQDVAANHPDVVEAMTKQLDAWWKP